MKDSATPTLSQKIAGVRRRLSNKRPSPKRAEDITDEELATIAARGTPFVTVTQRLV